MATWCSSSGGGSGPDSQRTTEAQLTVESGVNRVIPKAQIGQTLSQTLGGDSGSVDDKVEGYYPPAFVRWRTTLRGTRDTGK